MDIFEELVMWHLTRSGKVFLCPQYSISAGWACPDFIALDYERKIVSVVEVSAAASPDGLFKKVLAREEQWLARLRDQLRRAVPVDDSWKFQVTVYIRQNAANKFRQQLGEAGDVSIHTFEEVGFPWNWDWPSAKAEKEAAET